MAPSPHPTVQSSRAINKDPLILTFFTLATVESCLSMQIIVDERCGKWKRTVENWPFSRSTRCTYLSCFKINNQEDSMILLPSTSILRTVWDSGRLMSPFFVTRDTGLPLRIKWPPPGTFFLDFLSCLFGTMYPLLNHSFTQRVGNHGNWSN